MKGIRHLAYDPRRVTFKASISQIGVETSRAEPIRARAWLGSTDKVVFAAIACRTPIRACKSEPLSYVGAINDNNFELKHGLLTLVQNKQFFGHDKEDPHAHVRYFNKITSTLKFLNISNMSIKIMLFPFSLEGATWIWLKKEPPRLIFTWDDFVSKFINQLFPPSKTTNLRNEITNFQQRFDESFSEAWDRFKDLLRACPHHGFSELHQLDTFYNALNSKDQDSLNSAAGGNFLDKMPRGCLVHVTSPLLL
nr:reverse transcriptase domain-containing protein [Tanacetum cinerariifolium]